jgi:hypothetical protein
MGEVVQFPRTPRPEVFKYLGSIPSLPDNVFYKTPIVREIPRPQPSDDPEPPYNRPQSDALAA